MFNLFNPINTINTLLLETWELRHRGVKQFIQDLKLLNDRASIQAKQSGFRD